MYQEREISNEKEHRIEHIEPGSLILNMAQMRSAAYLMSFRRTIVPLNREKIIFEAVRREIDAWGSKITAPTRSDTSKATPTAPSKGKAKEGLLLAQPPRRIPIQSMPIVASMANFHSQMPNSYLYSHHNPLLPHQASHTFAPPPVHSHQICPQLHSNAEFTRPAPHLTSSSSMNTMQCATNNQGNCPNSPSAFSPPQPISSGTFPQQREMLPFDAYVGSFSSFNMDGSHTP